MGQIQKIIYYLKIIRTTSFNTVKNKLESECVGAFNPYNFVKIFSSTEIFYIQKKTYNHKHYALEYSTTPSTLTHNGP